MSVLTRKEAVPPLYTARLLRRDSRLRIWLLVRKLDQLVVWCLVFTSSIMALHSGHNPIFSMNCCFAVFRSID